MFFGGVQSYFVAGKIKAQRGKNIEVTSYEDGESYMAEARQVKLMPASSAEVRAREGGGRAAGAGFLTPWCCRGWRT